MGRGGSYRGGSLIYSAWTEWRTEDNGKGNPHYEKKVREAREAWATSPEAAAEKKRLQQQQIEELRKQTPTLYVNEYDRKKSELELGKVARDKARANVALQEPREQTHVLSAILQDARMEAVEVVRKIKSKRRWKP